ncbi:hypothetical protein Tco_0065731 [Tanacetum coccineum]
METGGPPKFWLDHWHTRGIFKDIFPDYTLLNPQRRLLVSFKIGDRGLVAPFRRIPRGGIEQNQFEAWLELVVLSLCTSRLTDGIWNLEVTGIFSVASALFELVEFGSRQLDMLNGSLCLFPIPLDSNSKSVRRSFVLIWVTSTTDELTSSACTCAPSPPSATTTSPPSPPTITFKPPQSPPKVHQGPPPPRFYYFDSPLGMSPPMPKSYPPPAYISSGGNNGGPSPPRFVYFPSPTAMPVVGGVGSGGGSANAGTGQNNYPYPYYMYDSKASCCSYIGILWSLMLLVCFHVTF